MRFAVLLSPEMLDGFFLTSTTLTRQTLAEPKKLRGKSVRTYEVERSEDRRLGVMAEDLL
jgi:hypothetical protein